jgi:hypothetical protein
VIEAWTCGAIRPVHAWPALRAGPGLDERMDQVLRARRPRYVLLSVGANAFEGPLTDNAGIAAALSRSGGRIARQWELPTEAGTPGWRLVEIAAP